MPSHSANQRRQDPGYIPRPRNKFVHFRGFIARRLKEVGDLEQVFTCQTGLIDAYRAEQKGPLPTPLPGEEFNKLVSFAWRIMTDEDRKFWEDKARATKRAHYLKYPGYKYQPTRRPTADGVEKAKTQKNPKSGKMARGKRTMRVASEPSNSLGLQGVVAPPSPSLEVPACEGTSGSHALEYPRSPWVPYKSPFRLGAGPGKLSLGYMYHPLPSCENRNVSLPLFEGPFSSASPVFLAEGVFQRARVEPADPTAPSASFDITPAPTQQVYGSPIPEVHYPSVEFIPNQFTFPDLDQQTAQTQWQSDLQPLSGGYAGTSDLNHLTGFGNIGTYEKSFIQSASERFSLDTAFDSFTPYTAVQNRYAYPRHDYPTPHLTHGESPTSTESDYLPTPDFMAGGSRPLIPDHDHKSFGGGNGNSGGTIDEFYFIDWSQF